jgi:monoterpene epsilon-lactone hydrolase
MGVMRMDEATASEMLRQSRQRVVQTRPSAPTSVSEEARAYLSRPPLLDGSGEWPALDDPEAWERLVAERDTPVREYLAPLMPAQDVVARTSLDIAGVPTFVLSPTQLTEQPDTPLFIDIHGGGLFQNGGDLAWMSSIGAAMQRSGITWAPDYRMPPRHPFPAALDDCLNLYRAALESRPPENIIISGSSAGGNLAASLLLRSKDEGLPMPAAVVLKTPEVDLTESGDSFRTNNGIDFLGSLIGPSLLYANGHDLQHPYLSPLFGDLSGFPPTFLQTGTRDLFLSNTVRMHRKLLAAGVPTELHVFEAMPHGSLGGASPEDGELSRELRRFERQHLPPERRAEGPQLA